MHETTAKKDQKAEIICNSIYLISFQLLNVNGQLVNHRKENNLKIRVLITINSRKHFLCPFDEIVNLNLLLEI